MIAYLDYGTGSMLLAALASGTAGIAVLFRMYGNRIMGVFSKKRREQARLDAAELMGAPDSSE